MAGEREIRAVPVPGVPGSEISVISVTAVNNTPVNSMRGWGTMILLCPHGAGARTWTESVNWGRKPMCGAGGEAGYFGAASRGMDDGRKKSFYTTAVYLLELDDLRHAVQQVTSLSTKEMSEKERAACMTQALQKIAEQQGLVLKLNKKQKRRSRGKHL